MFASSLKAALAALACAAAGAVAAQAPDDTPAPLRLSGSADYTSCKPPVYPESARRYEEQGISTLMFLVSPEGAVVDARVSKSSGSRALDRAALAAISQCRFRPASENGKPVQAWVAVQWVWTLAN